MTARDAMATEIEAGSGVRARLGLVLGPALFAIVLALPGLEGLADPARRTAAVAALMATWWITEPIPLPATALLPIVLFPTLGVLPVADAAAPYAHPLIFLFLGGFLLALGLERWRLHRRVALAIIAGIGTRPRRIVAGFMASAALLSMGISNTATTLMLLPIGLSVAGLAEDDEGRPREGDRFPTALMLAIAFGASIGGIGTLIGTPPNALTAAFLESTYGIRIGFARWLLVGLPLVLVALPLAYLILTRVAFPITATELPGGAEIVARARAALGPVSTPERRVALVFGLAALAWITRPLLEGAVPGLSDAGIALAAGLLLFALPSGVDGEPLLRWDRAARVPWGVLLLFGGGLSLASAIDGSGLAAWLAEVLGGLATWPFPLLLGIVALATILFSELASNTATAAAFLPVVGALAATIGLDPALLVVPAGLAASGGYMLPVATPPNAIVYASGRVTVPDLVRAGGLLDLVFLLLVPIVGVLVVPLVLG